MVQFLSELAQVAAAPSSLDGMVDCKIVAAGSITLEAVNVLEEVLLDLHLRGFCGVYKFEHLQIRKVVKSNLSPPTFA